MPVVKFLAALWLISISAPANKPHEVMHFFNKSSVWCYNNITLSSDSVYFYSGSCESDAALTKGKWKIEGDKLILANFDRKDSWPVCSVTAREFTAADSVHITVTDYFGNPFANIQLVIFDSVGNQDNIYADSNGCVTLAQSRCSAFDFNYKLHSTDIPDADSMLCHIKPGMNDVSVSIDYPATTNLDHEIKTIDFEHLEFTIKEGMLYDDSGKVVYNNRYFSDAVPPTAKDAGLEQKTKQKAANKNSR